MKKIKMLQDVPVSPDGLTVETWKKNEIKDVNEAMFKSFIEANLAVEYKPEPIGKSQIQTQAKKEPKTNGKRGRPKGSKKIKESPINKALKNSPENK